MSQIYKSLASGPIPPEIPTEFVTDDGTAIPSSNRLNVNGVQSEENENNGILTRANPDLSENLEIVLTNRQTGTVTTTDATLTTIITFPMGATPGTFHIFGNVQAFNSSTPSAGTFSFSGGYRTDGASSTELGTEFHDDFKDSALMTADIFLSSSGNNILLQVQGVVGLSINWNSLLEFRKVS